jgi:hypothetical protein
VDQNKRERENPNLKKHNDAQRGQRRRENQNPKNHGDPENMDQEKQAKEESKP